MFNLRLCHKKYFELEGENLKLLHGSIKSCVCGVTRIALDRKGEALEPHEGNK